MSEPSTITLSGTVYNVPPLNTGQVRKHWPALVECLQALKSSTGVIAQAGAFGAEVDRAQSVVLLALQNQYPHLTLEDLDPLLNDELQEALGKVITATGLGSKANQGEALAPASR
jgi:hypothetical protein